MRHVSCSQRLQNMYDPDVSGRAWRSGGQVMQKQRLQIPPCLGEQGADIASRYVGSTGLADGGALWAARCACSRDWHALHCGRRPGRLLRAFANI